MKFKEGTYYARNREAILAKAKAKYASLTIEERAERIRKAQDWFSKNRVRAFRVRRPRLLIWQRQWRMRAPEGYIRLLLSSGSTLSPSEWPVGLVLSKQAHLKLKRLCRNLRT